MKKKLMGTLCGGGFEFQVWKRQTRQALDYKIGVRKRRDIDLTKTTNEDADSFFQAMRDACELVRHLEATAPSTNERQGTVPALDIHSPHPSPAPREDRIAARPLPLDGLPAQTIAEGGCAEKTASGWSQATGIRVLSRSGDSVEMLLNEEEEP